MVAKNLLFGNHPSNPQTLISRQTQPKSTGTMQAGGQQGATFGEMDQEH